MKLWNMDFQSVGPAELHSADNERSRQNICRAHGRRPMFRPNDGIARANKITDRNGD